MKSVAAFTGRTRIFLRIAYILSVLLLLAGACTIPFVFESSTMFYKFGLEKTLLCSGKVAGIIAAAIVFFQVVLVSRFKIQDKIFALNRIYSIHRINGIVIAVLALLHPILILAAEGFTLFPLEKRYWPEFLGIGLFIFILGLVITSNWRSVFGLSYKMWLRIHRLAVLGVIIAAGIHILFVSETFESGLPRALVFAAVGLNVALIMRLWYRRLFTDKR